MAQKVTTLDFSSFTGGLNTVDDPVKLSPNQVQRGTMNAILTDAGAKRRPGMLGVKSTALFDDYLKGLHNYLMEDGSEILLALSAGHIYDVNKTTYALSDRYNMGGTGEGCFKNFKNKAWVCNGSTVCKVENNVAYRVGIAKPSGATAVAAAGGSLAAGVYKIFLSYYRKVSGVIVLYSEGQSVTDVTLSGGNGTIAVSVPATSDAQVSGAAIWMTDADGSVHYFYGNADYTTGAITFDVTDDTDKNANLLYAVEAVNNQLPPNFTQIEFHNNYLWGVDPTTKHRVWYSMKSGTVYDLERFPYDSLVGSGNYIDYPFEVTGLIGLGQNLYVNTKGGLIIQPYGDPTLKYDWIDKRYQFEYMNTVAFWGGSVIGLTNDGVRSFDGTSFSPDLTWKVKDLVKPISNSAANHYPCGWIVKRSNRTEYHLSYQDTSIGTKNNNRQLVLNLDTLQQITASQVTAAWEEWDNGAEYVTVDSSGVAYHGQSYNSASTIWKENSNSTDDWYVYNPAGTFLTTSTHSTVTLVTRTQLPSMQARIKFNKIRLLAKINSQVDILFQIADRLGVSNAQQIGPVLSPARFGFARFGIDKFTKETIDSIRKYLPMSMNGYSCYVSITQTGDDNSFQILNVTVEGFPTIGRFV